MATQAQIIANRANAQQSTGPKTPEGIAHCKFNATKHGLTGKHLIIEGEDRAAYDALHASLVADYNPQSEPEAAFVEMAARNYWRLQRAQKVEASILETWGAEACFTDPAAIAAFNRIHRYLRSCERSWEMAVQQLERLRRERADAARKAADDAAHGPRIGSVSYPTATLVDECSTAKPSASASMPCAPIKSELYSPRSASSSATPA